MRGLFSFAVSNKELRSYEERVEYYNQFYVLFGELVIAQRTKHQSSCNKADYEARRVVAAANAHRARPGLSSPPARGRETPFVPTGGPLCPATVVAAARLDASSTTTMPVLRNTAISGTIIDFDTSSHARMHTAAAFQTRSRRDCKKTQVR